METANIVLAIGGDKGHQVPKYGVTASEIAVLRSIHGDESVTDVEVVGEVPRTGREERTRLMEAYGHAEDGNGTKIVVGLFPGAASRMFDTVAELELDEMFLKAERVVKPAKAPKAEKPAKKAGKKSDESIAGDLGIPMDDDDGIQDINE